MTLSIANGRGQCHLSGEQGAGKGERSARFADSADVEMTVTATTGQLRRRSRTSFSFTWARHCMRLDSYLARAWLARILDGRVAIRVRWL